MSDPERAIAANAIDVETRAAEWLERSVSEQWTSENQSALDAWLAQSPAHIVTFWRLKAAWSRTHRLAALGDVSAEAPAHAPQPCGRSS